MANKVFDIEAYRSEMAILLKDQHQESAVFWDALSFAEEAHKGQKRKSGDPYILHPCNVAKILVQEMDVRDQEILASALLHDTVEDVEWVTTEIIGEKFGRNVENIVDGCTKIIHFSGDKQNFYKLVHRKLFSGAASQFGVMLVKLADRLHNLRTLDAMPRDRRQKISDETIDIYAPLASIMGFYNLKRELYDLALTYKFPRQSSKVTNQIRKMADRPEVLEIISSLQAEMKAAWVDCEIKARVKGLWAYYDPRKKKLNKEIEHPQEFIVLINDTHSCYRALGLINQNFPPIPRTIRDFIANPKPTGYQGLHARANIKGQNYLFKIRTPEMACRAQRGIIKEWSADARIQDSFEKELREMFDILGTDEGLSPRDMIAASGGKEIYTFTPKGDRICLPKDSIVLDFAFRVHTAVGNRCIGAYIGKKKVGPDAVLVDGDRIKVICQDQPVLFDPLTQELCQTPRARSNLAKSFHLRHQTLARDIGSSILNQELKPYNLSGKELRENKDLDEILALFNANSFEELLIGIGEGHTQLANMVSETIERFFPEKKGQVLPERGLNSIELSTIDPAGIKLSACCKPVPSHDDLIGLLSERGLSIHQETCPRYLDLHVLREEKVKVHWLLKETTVTKQQHLFIAEASRNRLLMLLAVAPDTMRVSEINVLSRIETKKPAWEITFAIPTLYDLKNTLQHFTKAGIDYEFVLEQ